MPLKSAFTQASEPAVKLFIGQQMKASLNRGRRFHKSVTTNETQAAAKSDFESFNIENMHTFACVEGMSSKRKESVILIALNINFPFIF